VAYSADSIDQEEAYALQAFFGMRSPSATRHNKDITIDDHGVFTTYNTTATQLNDKPAIIFHRNNDTTSFINETYSPTNLLPFKASPYQEYFHANKTTEINLSPEEFAFLCAVSGLSGLNITMPDH
jgi:hypothetical protein